MEIKRVLAVASVIALFAIVSNAGYSYGASTLANSFCSYVLSNPTVSAPLSPKSSLIEISFLIMALFVTIVGIAYGIGYAFGINKLRDFSKKEFGEIIITIFIIIAVLGTGSIINSFEGGGSVFQSTCTSLSATSVGAIPTIVVFYALTRVVEIIENIKIGINMDIGVPSILPAGIRVAAKISLEPFVGLTVFNKVFSMGLNVVVIMLVLVIMIIIALSLIHSLFPIFLLAGIVLRTIPWTRAAGGALIGIFIGFYIFFPAVLNAFLGINSVSGSTANIVNPSITSNLASTITSSSTFLTSLFTSTQSSGGLSAGIIEDVAGIAVAPLVYAFIAIIISLILSFDFAETLADYLGAPSFTTDKIRGLI